MREDDGPDSDSSGGEFRRRIMRPRRRRSKGARVCNNSRTTMSLQDPMPEYVDPELVKLIAQNAPFELDVFMRSLHKSSTRRWAESGGRRDRAAKEGERRPLAVEALLSSMRERNDHLSIRQGGQDIRHSCPDGLWSDYGETDESICRATTVKRKRPKSVDSSRLPPSDRQCPSEVSFRVSDNKGRGKLRRASVSTNSSAEGSRDECRSQVNPDAFDVSSAAAPLADGNDCDVLSAKPWRHGMRKGKRSAKEERPPNASCCKRKAETDSRKTSEVRNYMETKMEERRKERQQLKAEADAALAARKEQQRKLDLHQQSIFQSQVADAKSRGHSPRPAWVSEFNSLCEPPRPWSSSSGELDTYLPPPVTPPNLDPVYLDLYTSRLQFAEVRTLRTDEIQVQNTNTRESRRSKKARGCSREVQRQLNYGRSKSMKVFPRTDLDLAKLVNCPVSRKARLKATSKLRERKVSSEEVFQRQLLEHDESYSQRRSGDLEVYKRSLKRQLNSNGGCLCSAKESRPRKSTSNISRKTSVKPVRPVENGLKSVIKGQTRPVTKVKRLKATEHFIPGKVKELTRQELATLLNANSLPSDCESETNVTRNGQVIAERMIVVPSQTSPAIEQESITDLRKCVDHSLGSPHKNSADEDALCKWFAPSVECSEQHVIDEEVLQERTGQVLGSSFKPSRYNKVQSEVLNFKEKTGDTGIVPATRKNPTMVVRWQRMQLLKNLAEQLVKRVDEACAKKRQIEHSAVEQTSFPSMDINSEPSGQLSMAESGHRADILEPKVKLNHQPNLNNGVSSIHLAGSLGEKIQDSEPKFFHQSKQNNIINYRGLTEQEQAGFEPSTGQTGETQSKMKKLISSPRRASRTETTDYKAAGGPPIEICTMKEWTTSDKCTDIICNNASAFASFGSSSPSTASISPVALPSSTKYHVGRIKHSKMVSSEAKTRQPKKEDWIIPAVNDTHSIFNVFTQHLIDRKKLGASTLTPKLQNDLDNSATDEIEIDPGIAGLAAEVGISNVPSVPLSRKFSVPEVPMKLQEPMMKQTTGHADCNHESTESPESDGIGPDLRKKHDVSSPNFESLQQSRADKSTTKFPPGLTLKTSAIELAGFHPEWTVLEIGDLKVCQSPTAIHFRLDRCMDNGEDRKAEEQKFENINHEPNVRNCTEASTNTSVRANQETGGKCVKNVPSPMKITYARRVHSRGWPDDKCTNGERVVVEWHQMNSEVPPVASQGDTKFGSSELDASEEAQTGLPGSRQSKVIGNAQSQFVETRAEHSSVNEVDFKEVYLFKRAEASGASEPVINCASEHKLKACDGETRSLSTMLTCQKGELPIQLNLDSKLDPQIEIRDSEEWELKLRRDQLEAELKKLDAEIMKTRAKLHQRQPMIDSQARSVSSISFTDRPVEDAFKFSNIQKRFAKYMAISDKHNDVIEESTDLQMQKIVGTHTSVKALKDGEKTVTTSNSYSDSFISEETELGPKTCETGNRDCFVDHLLSTQNIDVDSRSFRDLKTGIQQFETVLENGPRYSQSNALKQQAEVPSNCKMPSTRDESASEGSQISTGRGPGTRLDKSPEVDCDESTARCRKSKTRQVPLQMAEDDGATRLYVKNERTTLQRHAVCTSDELLDALHDVVNAEEKSGKGPWRLLHSSPQQTEEKVIRRNEEQICLEQKGRNAQEPLEHGVAESPSSVVQSGAQYADNSKNPTPGGGDDKSGLTADMEIFSGTRTPPGIKQNGWPVKGDEGKSQSSASKKQTESQSHCKVPRTQDELSFEGSDRGTGRGSRRLEKPLEVGCDESTARYRTSKVRPVTDQMVQIDVAGVRLFAKDERTMLQSRTVCSRDGLLDAVHTLIDAEERSGRGPWVPLHPIPQQSEEIVLGKNKAQTGFQQTGRKAQELFEYGAGESPSPVVQCWPQNSDNIKERIPGGKDDNSAVSGGVEIIPGNRTSPGVKQNGRSLKAEKINATSRGVVEVPRGPIDEQTENQISHAAVPSTLLWSARSLEDGSERVSSIELSKSSQTIQDELASRKRACSKKKDSLLAVEDSSRIVTTGILPFPLPALGQSEESVPLVPNLHHGLQNPVELPQQNPFQCNTGLSNEEKGQMMVDDVWNRPTCSQEGKMSDEAAPTVPEFIYPACLAPPSIPCGSNTEEAPWQCLSLPSHMDFSTIREKLRNNKLASDEHPVTDGWSVNSQNNSFDSPTSTTGGESSGGHILVSESILTSDVPLNSKDIPECSPEVDATQDSSFLTLLSRPESTNITDPNNHFIGTQGLIMPVCSARNLPGFLPSLYFHQRTTTSNVPEEVDSIISEDIEHYESDVEEELQDDVDGPASCNFESTCTSPPRSNDFTSPTPDSGCCLGGQSPNAQVCHPEPPLSVSNELTDIVSHAQKCSSSDCTDLDLSGRVPEPRLAGGMCSPSIMSPRCAENPPPVHAGGQKKSLASTCASPESSDGKVLERPQSVRPFRNEDSSLQDISRISLDYYCGSEVSESQDQSENISEELPSIDNELSSNGSGPAREMIHNMDAVELDNLEEMYEVGEQSSGDEGQNHHCNAMACTAPSDPDFVYDADKQHPGSVGHIAKAAGIAKQNPDMNFLYTSCVVTETASSEDNSLCRPVNFASHHASETSQPIELPLSIVLPPLRPSKHFKQYDGTHVTDALRSGKLSTEETFFENALSNNEEHLSTEMAGLQLESAYTGALTETRLADSPAPISSPGVMMKTFNNTLHCEQNDPATVCTLELTRVEDEIAVQKTFDVEVICLSPHQVGPFKVSEVEFSVDLAQKVDCNSEDCLTEVLEEVGQHETFEFTGADSSLGNQNIYMGEEVTNLAVEVRNRNISGFAGAALEKLPHQDTERLNVSIPLDCASLYTSTCTANDTLDCCPFPTSIGIVNGKQLLGERKITKIDSNRSLYSFNGEKSIGGPPTSMHLIAQENRDVLSLPRIEDGDRAPNMYLRPDQIIASCQASTSSRPSPLFGCQKIVNLDKDAEFEGRADQQNSDVCSLQVLRTNFLAQHDGISDSNCSNEGVLSHLLEHIAGTGLIGGVPEAPLAEDLEACSSESYSLNPSSLIFAEDKEEVRSCEILDGVGLNSYQVSGSGIPEDRTQSTTCLATLHEASSCADASPKLEVRMQMDVNRAKKLDIMTDLVTSLIYEDLLSVELSGLYQAVGSTPASLQVSSQAIQTASVTKTVNSNPKRSRKISEFCHVLKHFLPTGWRSASIRHKKGLFLHVEGLRPHPLNPASKAMRGTLKLNVQYPNYRQSEHFPSPTNAQFLLLDVNDVHSYVQRSFELSSLILDPSPANWYDSRKPVGEDSFSALESQFWETGYMFGNSRWQMHKTLILDLINEALLKQFATKFLVPSFSMKTPALPVGGENLVQFVTKEIMEHERYASNRGFDIEKVIAKAFEDEHWEKCAEEARDIVGDLEQGILCDLIEKFVYEMVRGWDYHINQRHVLAS